MRGKMNYTAVKPGAQLILDHTRYRELGMGKCRFKAWYF
jgi:hypothetical protein